MQQALSIQWEFKLQQPKLQQRHSSNRRKSGRAAGLRPPKKQSAAWRTTQRSIKPSPAERAPHLLLGLLVVEALGDLGVGHVGPQAGRHQGGQVHGLAAHQSLRSSKGGADKPWRIQVAAGCMQPAGGRAFRCTAFRFSTSIRANKHRKYKLSCSFVALLHVMNE